MRQQFAQIRRSSWTLILFIIGLLVALSVACAGGDNAARDAVTPSATLRASPPAPVQATQAEIFEVMTATMVYATAQNLSVELGALVEGAASASQQNAVFYAIDLEVSCFAAKDEASTLWTRIELVCGKASPGNASGGTGMTMLIDHSNFEEALRLTEDVGIEALIYLADRAGLSMPTKELGNAALLVADSVGLVEALDDQLNGKDGGVTPAVAALRALYTRVECNIAKEASDELRRSVADACEAANKDGRLSTLISLGDYAGAREIAAVVRDAATCPYFTLLHLESDEWCPSGR